MSDLLAVEVESGIATLRLQRPPMNALNVEIQDALRAAAEEVTERRDVSAVVVYGGEKVFAAGADIKEMEQMSYTDMVAHSRRLQSAFTAVARIPKPTVAAITGYALGGGCELAMTCDFRVAAKNAKLGQPEILLGLIPGQAAHSASPGSSGQPRPRTSSTPGASSLQTRRSPSASSTRSPRTCMPRREPACSSTGGPAFALRAAKTAIDRGIEVDLETGLEIESMQFAGLFATKDRAIGMKSFVEHGPGKAKFEGA